MAKLLIGVTVNGDTYEVLVQPWQTLLGMLRDDLQLTGTKEGCSNGNCGACTVLFEGRTVDSCLVLAAECDGKEVTTVEGIAQEGRLHPVQKAYIELGALQCGFCTPGFIVSSKYLLDNIPNPSEHEIRLNLAGNLCRCTGYDKIVRAVQAVARGEF